MESSKNIMEIIGKQFLKCQQEDCEWNTGWLGGNSWAEESGKGTRVCNLGIKCFTFLSVAERLEQASQIHESQYLQHFP